MNFFKSINFKIIVPPFILFLIVVVFAVFIGGNFFSNSSKSNIETNINSESERLNTFLKASIKKSEEVVSLYSSMINVDDKFYSYFTRNKLDSCKILMKKSLSNIDFKASYKIDIVLPKGEKVFSNNSNYFGDNNESSIISKVVSTRELSYSFENIYNEKYLISASPILFKNNVVGVVLISQPINKIFNNYFIKEGVDLVLIADNNRIIYSSNTEINDVSIFKEKPVGNYIYYNNFVISKVDKINKENNLGIDTYLVKNTKGENDFVSDLLFYLLLFSIGAFIIGGSIYTYGIYKTILAPVKKINDKIIIVSKGESTEELNSKSKDELGQISASVDDMIGYNRRTSDFAKKIGQGELEVEFEAISEKDEIGNALLGMREALKQAKTEEENRKLEDEKRNWATKGFAEFGEILRQNNDNIEAFSINILRNLINYTGSNQGGLFIFNDSDKHNPVLDLVASYAYDRQKYIEKTIKLGEGLVGTCAIEKELIYLTDVPDDYVEITSGLGNANPRNILLVPLKVEEQLFGVIELASFDIFDDYKQDFIVKLGESIASSLSSTKINIMTAELLEQAQQQQEEMKAQEEELRQNMEEMQATQEESARKEAEMSGLYQAVNNNSLLADFDLNGNIISINDRFAKLFGVDKDSFVGVHYDKIITESEGMTSEELGVKIRSGEVVSVKSQVKTSSGKIYWLSQTFAPVKSENGDIYKIINISNDITEEREKEIELRQQQEEMKSQEEEMMQNMEEMLAVQEELTFVEQRSKILLEAAGDSILYYEFAFDGTMKAINKSYVDLLELENSSDIIGKNYLEISDLGQKEAELEDVVNNFKNGEAYSRESKITSPSGKEFLMDETFTPVLDEYEKVIKIVGVSKIKN